MAQRDIVETTRARLATYDFSQDIIKRVARLSGEIDGIDTYQELFKRAGVPLRPSLFMTANGRGVPLVDIDARQNPEVGVLVVHLPMGNSLDPNQLYQVAVLSLAFPAHRIIAFGNPSGKPFAYREENLSLRDWWRVGFTRNRRAVVSVELEYLASQGVKNAYHIGYSYGALKAVLAAYYGDADTTKGLVLLDPVAHPRYPQQLLKDFTATFKPLGEYVNRTELQTFFDARQDAVKFVHYSQGIMRPVNIAIGVMLARADFVSLLSATLEKQSGISAFVAWGSKSELGNDAHMSTSLAALDRKASGRVHRQRLKGDSHAFANDLLLEVALVNRALRAF